MERRVAGVGLHALLERHRAGGPCGGELPRRGAGGTAGLRHPFALNTLNGAHFIFQGARYKILKAELNNLSGKPGEIIGDSLEIACKEKSIKVMMIQREGKKPQKTAEFLLGSQIKKGLFLSNV